MPVLTRVSTEELVKDLAARLHVSVEDARKTFLEVCAGLREHLQAGATVELDNLCTLAVSGSPEVREDESGGFSAYAPKAKSLVAKPIGAFRGDIERSKQAAIYYIARNGEGRFLEVLTDHFRRRGWNLVHTRNAMEVQTRLGRQPPVALIFESHVEGWRELLRELKCDPKTNGVPIVGIFPETSKEAAAETLTVQPDGVIYEPFDFADFVKTAGSELAARVAAPPEDSVQIAFDLPGSLRERQNGRALVEELLYRVKMPEGFVRNACAALDEALDNAVRHGHKNVECCTISVRMILDPRRLVISVRDTGAGFDHAAALAAARGRKKSENPAADHLLRAAQALRTRRGGEPQEGGIARMLRLVHRVEYNRQGNEVVLTKFRPQAGDPPTDAK